MGAMGAMGAIVGVVIFKTGVVVDTLSMLVLVVIMFHCIRFQFLTKTHIKRL
jgi:hypothetical protein